jgi:3-hydroxymyristoyl/3-hydroxydecanoyl-(acyl carrier protein) dehydratase
MTGFSRQFVIPDTHPTLAGHFPGNPVVPGVVILQQLETAVREFQGEVVITGFPRVKFSRLLLPNTVCDIQLTEKKPRQLMFECVTEAGVAVSGLVELAELNKHS